MRKFRRILVVVALFTLHYAKAQSTNQADKTGFFPVSPQAGTLGKYGDIPVDLCTGKVNFTIPIYTIKDGDFEFPIQLSYNYNGLQVGEMFGQVGAGWSINSSGYISVGTRGGNDFSSFNTLGFINNNIGKDIVKPFVNGDWNSLPTDVRKEKVYNLYSGAASGRLDTESDKYIVNSGNLNFSFYLDEEANPVFNNDYKNYKIDLERSTFPNFKITDDQGNKYTFGKAETTELLTEDYTPYETNSAYNLTSILTAKNRAINFSYFEDTVGQDSYSDELIIPIEFAISDLPESCPRGRQITPFNGQYNKITRNNVSEITYANGRVTFTYLDNNYKGNRLSQIKIFDKNNNLINRFEFIYDINKNLLLEVKKYDHSNNAIPFYKLDYYGSIPDGISLKSQDLWGYYNGENNYYLVTGNRKINFDNTRLGALKKITYPTGGFSEIEYEQNTSKTNPYGEDCSNVQYNAGELVEATSGPLNNHQAANQSKVVYIPYKQIVKLELKSDAGDQTGCIESVTAGASAFFQGYDRILPFLAYALCSPDHSNMVSSWAECMPGYKYNKTIILDYGPGNITIEAGSTETNTTTSTASVMLYYNNYVPNNFPVGGIRVKSIKDYSKPDNNFIEKKYTYEESEGISSGNILYKSVRFFSWSCTGNRYVTYKSKSMLPLDSYNGNPVIYSNVKEKTYGGTILKSSKTYKYSIFPPNLDQFFIDDDRYNNQNGKLLNEKDLNSSSVPVTTETNFYSNFNYNSKKVIGFKSVRTGSHSSFISSSSAYLDSQSYSIDISAFFYTKPYIYEYKTFNLVKKETELINSTGTISKTENYEYNNFNQLNKQTTKSSANDILETNYFYPQDPQMATKLFVNDLKTANIVGSPIVTQTYKGTQKISEQETVYAKDATTNNLVLPKQILAAKGTQTPETKITYNSYDDKGNVTQYTPEGGIPVAVIWGYNKTQPIAKIENATYTQVQTYVANLQTLSNGTDENALLVALNTLRTSLPNAMVTTYTHKPLVGVSTITDPKGNRITYTYDSFNRLQSVKDHQGNIINENEYHYRPQ